MKFYINGKEVKPPENFDESIEFSISMAPNEYLGHFIPPSEMKLHPNQWLIDMFEKQQKCDHDFCLKVDMGNKCYKCDLILMQI